MEDRTTLVPTYHRFGTAVLDASPLAVRYGDTTPDLRIQPVKGRLWSIQGKGSGECDRLTMITDTGRRSLNAGEFHAERLTPGPYEAEAVPADKGQYAESLIADGRLVFPQRDGRFLFDLSYRPTISVALKKGAPSISGTVLSEGKPVLGAAVFVELFDPRLANGDQRLRLWSLRSDVSGKFALNGLMPGSYRVLSSFDFDPMDRYAMDRAKSVLLKAGDINVQELKMLP